MKEVRITDEVRIQAPREAAWLAIEHPATHPQWHPFVTAIPIIGRKFHSTHRAILGGLRDSLAMASASSL
jgi:hypothetical protein